MDPRAEISSRAFSKIISHAAKYPSCGVNGLLLSPKSGGDPLLYSDAIPLFHDIKGLTPMLEVALAQIEVRFGFQDLVISGVYHANELFENVEVDIFNQRLADKVSELCPHPGILITIDNAQLSRDMQRGKDALLVRRLESNGKWRVRDEDENDVLLEDGSVKCVARILATKTHKGLVDFDNHLDDISQDYANTAFNKQVESFMARIYKDD